MKPHFATKDLELFYKYLDEAHHYFEFGSGGSTYQAAQRSNIKSVYSIESDNFWYEQMKNALSDKKHVQIMYIDMESVPNTWGHPGPKSTRIQKKRYSDQILLLDSVKRDDIDLILIDGRFRVACCLKCFHVVHKDCRILFDDFLDREYYHIVLHFFTIIDQTDDCRMVVLKKKEVETVDTCLLEELIQTYQWIAS